MTIGHTDDDRSRDRWIRLPRIPYIEPNPKWIRCSSAEIYSSDDAAGRRTPYVDTDALSETKDLLS